MSVKFLFEIIIFSDTSQKLLLNKRIYNFQLKSNTRKRKRKILKICWN